MHKLRSFSVQPPEPSKIIGSFSKAALTGSIVLSDSVRDLIRAQSARAEGFRQWNSTIEVNHPILAAFRVERNFAMHQRLTAVHGLGHRNTVRDSG